MAPCESLQTIIQRLHKLIDVFTFRAGEPGYSADCHQHVVYTMMKFVQKDLLFFYAAFEFILLICAIDG